MDNFTLANDKPPPVLWKGPPKQEKKRQVLLLCDMDDDPRQEALFNVNATETDDGTKD